MFTLIYKHTSGSCVRWRTLCVRCCFFFGVKLFACLGLLSLTLWAQDERRPVPVVEPPAILGPRLLPRPNLSHTLLPPPAGTITTKTTCIVIIPQTQITYTAKHIIVDVCELSVFVCFGVCLQIREIFCHNHEKTDRAHHGTVHCSDRHWGYVLYMMHMICEKNEHVFV